MEQIDRAMRTSPSLRYGSLKLLVLFLISRMGSRTAGAMRSTSSGMRLRALRAFKIVLEMGER